MSMLNRYDSTPPLVVPSAPGAGSFSMATLIESVVDPFITVAVLFLAAYLFQIVPDGHYVILGLLAFSLTFPGDIHLFEPPRRMVTRTILHWALAAGVLLAVGFMTGYVDYFAGPVLAAWLAVTPIAMVAAHAAARSCLPQIMSLEGTQRRAVIVGLNDTARQLAHNIREKSFLGVRLLGSFDDRKPERLGDLSAGEHLGRLRDVGDYARRNALDHVYIALPMSQQPRILGVLDDLKDTTVSIFFVPDLFITDLIQGRVDDVAGTPVVAVCETPFTGIDGLVKRLSDVILALLILVLIAPLMLVIAVGVKASSPGPVIFRQNRYGLDGRRIVVYKFRSMTVCEDGAVVVQAHQGDARVTPFGAFLRRTSMDELPQFINVIQGRMSVVGPRPHAVAHNEAYRRLIKGYMVRHKVRPGITGWAQVNGCRGETDTVEKMVRRIEYDLDYLRHWSLALDLIIVLKTIRLVLKDTKAY
jgi:Undecaprenyl-phosphate glucose phosphotransferase